MFPQTHAMNTMTTTGASNGAGMNQMFEIIKMQYIMKLFDGNGSSHNSLLSFVVLMAYDNIIKYFPQLLSLLSVWLTTLVYGNNSKQDHNPQKEFAPLLPTSPPPPASKPIKAFIQFERNINKTTDPQIEAVIHHVCNMSDVRSLRYNGTEMMPNFKEPIMIDNDVWFEILQNTTATGIALSSGNDPMKPEPIIYRLSTYDHDITWLHRFVEQAIGIFEQDKKNKLGSEIYYFDQIVMNNNYNNAITSMFTKSKFQSNRTLENVYLSKIDELKERVEFFMRRRDWYDLKGIPHTLGIVMYGHPGCGKTSTIKAIANDTKRHIFNIMLSEIKTKDALKDLFYNDIVNVNNNGRMEALNIPLKQRLYVIEDIDAMESIVIKRTAEQIKKDEERKHQIEVEAEALRQSQGEAAAKRMLENKDTTKDTNKLDLATLLNVLDGVRETPGRIIILSTNYPERLDEALLRPGRFDMMLEFEKHSCKVLKLHLEKHYDTILTNEQWLKLNTSELNYKWTPAEVSQILFRRVFDINAAIDDLVKETPEKLFKYSQMKKEEDKPNDAAKGTDLMSLLQDAEQKTPSPELLPKTEEADIKEDKEEEMDDESTEKTISETDSGSLTDLELDSEDLSKYDDYIKTLASTTTSETYKNFLIKDSPKKSAKELNELVSTRKSVYEDEAIRILKIQDTQKEFEEKLSKRVKEQETKFEITYEDENKKFLNVKNTKNENGNYISEENFKMLATKVLTSPMFDNDFLGSADSLDIGCDVDYEGTIL